MVDPLLTQTALAVLTQTVSNILGDAATRQFAEMFKGWPSSGSRAQSQARMSADAFVSTRNVLRSQRTLLARLAYYLPTYSDDRVFGEVVPLLGLPDWLSALPHIVSLPEHSVGKSAHELETVLIADPEPSTTSETSARIVDATCGFLPADSAGRQQDYVGAIASIEKPDERFFHDLPSYRFMGQEDTAVGRTLRFARSTYFDYQRTSEVLCLEFAWHLHRLLIKKSELQTAAQRNTLYTELSRLLVARAAASPWHRLERRHSIAGVNVLLIVREADGDHRFIMMQRHAKLASAMGTYHVIPAGEFQPSSTAPEIIRDECSLWYTFLREFAEEVLGCSRAETHSTSAYLFDQEEPFAGLIHEARNGFLRLWFLGQGCDPLSLKAEMLCAAVIERAALDRVLKARTGADRNEATFPDGNREGTLFSGRDRRGVALTRENIELYRDDPHILPAGSACLELAERFREQILGAA